MKLSSLLAERCHMQPGCNGITSAILSLSYIFKLTVNPTIISMFKVLTHNMRSKAKDLILGGVLLITCINESEDHV